MGNEDIFLDEKLYNRVKLINITQPSHFEDMLIDLYNICQDHYKAKIKMDMGIDNRSLKAEIDKCFKSWDIMVQRLKKENFIFWDLIEKYSFKSEFMDNEKLNEVYHKL